VWVSVRDHRKTVANDRDVDPRHFGPFGRGVVRHGHVDHLFSGPLRLPDFRDGPLFPLFFAVGGGFARNARRAGQSARPRFVLCHGQPESTRDLIYLLYVRADASRWSSGGGLFGRRARRRVSTRWFRQIFADWLFCSTRRRRRLHAYARPASRAAPAVGRRYHGHLSEHATREIPERRRLR